MIRCIVVTPEKTEIDIECEFVSLPMFDGQLGVQKQRSAMIGRLGYGVLRLATADGSRQYFIDGGFAQVENDIVSVLTGQSIPVSELSRSDAGEVVEKALAMEASSEETLQLKETALQRARGMLRAAEQAG
ncbi:MAG: F0F1 ATP synthase subunit epsilon [Planctomycetota bacterium]